MDALRESNEYLSQDKNGELFVKKYLHNQVMMLSTYVLAEMYSKRIKPTVTSQGPEGTII